jgi:hypothetical protein
VPRERRCEEEGFDVSALVRAVSRRRVSAGLAIGLVFILAGSTLAASRGAPWRVGYVETIATYTTGLSGALAGSVLSITNGNLSTTATAARAISAITRARRSVALFAQNTAGGPAAQFLVGTTTALSSAAPFVTNARGLVTNLNADLLDGLTSADFLRATGKAADADKLDGLDSAALQARVGSTCAVGSSIRAINADGTVDCEADNEGGTTYTGAHPIDVSGTTIGLSTTRCATGQVYKLGGGEERGWACAPDSIDGGDAQTLDGIDSTALAARASRGTAAYTILEDYTWETIGSVTLTAPAAGYVFVMASAYSSGQHPSVVFLRLRDTGTNATSPEIAPSSFDSSYGPVSLTELFPVSAAGAKSFVLEGHGDTASDRYDGGASSYPLIAVYVPFGATGARP